MTRHRRDDEDGLDGDAPWRARDYDRAPARRTRPVTTTGALGRPRGGRGAPGAGRARYLQRAGRPARRGNEPALGAHRPPWELPGWDEAVPARRRPRDDSAHPSGPLPQVSSGPHAPPVIRRVATGDLRALAAGSAGAVAAGRAGYPDARREREPG